jgi:hypothetical protein
MLQHCRSTEHHKGTKGVPFKKGKPGKAAWTEELFDETLHEETTKTDDPFDLVAVTNLHSARVLNQHFCAQ